MITVDRPADFESFWTGLLAELDAVPANASFEHLPHRSTDLVDTFEVRYDSIDGVRIAGWYCVPRHVPPPYPAVLSLPGYVSEPEIPKAWAERGYAAFGVAPRGKLRSNRQYDPGYPGLLTHNIVDRGTYGYRGFYLDAVRAVEVVAARPEVDTDRIGVTGSSQGGALTVVLAALRPGLIRCGTAGAPYLCGIVAAAGLTRSQPYEEINDYLRAYPDRLDAVRETVAYFDGINFAPMISTPLLVYIGLADDVCPPETGFALRDALVNAPVEFHAHADCSHDAGHHWMAPRVVEFLADRLRPGGR
jgi:cephalosporin-C deacetylase